MLKMLTKGDHVGYTSSKALPPAPVWPALSSVLSLTTALIVPFGSVAPSGVRD